MALKSILDTSNGQHVVDEFATPPTTVVYVENAETVSNESILTEDESYIDPLIVSLNGTYGAGRFTGSNPKGKPRH